jgi:hypothetical protein
MLEYFQTPLSTHRDASASEHQDLLRFGDESDGIVDRVVLLELVSGAQAIWLRVSAKMYSKLGRLTLASR